MEIQDPGTRSGEAQGQGVLCERRLWTGWVASAITLCGQRISESIDWQRGLHLMHQSAAATAGRTTVRKVTTACAGLLPVMAVGLILAAGAGRAADDVPAGDATSTSAAAASSSSPISSSAASTSATLSSSSSGSAPVVAVPPPAAPAQAIKQPDTAAATDKAAAKPATAAASPQAKPAKARKKAKPVEEVVAPPPEPPKPQNLLEALFGNSNQTQPSASDATSDPASTATTASSDAAATDAATTQGKKSSKPKLAKAKDKTAALSKQDQIVNGPDVLVGDDSLPQASGELGYPLLSPANIEPLKAAIKRYSDIVDAGGWPMVPPFQMEVGTNSPAVAILRQRLIVEGDLKGGEPSAFTSATYFDTELSTAVHRFQERYGLTATGDLMDRDRLKNGTRTVMALNVPAIDRLKQLKANLVRVNQQQRSGKGRYVLVNIPSEQIEAVESDQVALRLNGVVGKPDRPSPMLASSIGEVKFNPIWTLPPTVIKEDLIPKGRAYQQKGQDILVKAGIDAYDGNGKKVDTAKINWNTVDENTYRFSQQPSKDNPLGFAKLDFASPESVYMHDTPSAKLFDKSYRAASSGCIRVDHMEVLVTWLLKETDGWNREHVMSMKETGESEIVHLKRAVPLFWVYITAWATQDGVVHFRRDLYGKDQAFGVSQLASAY